MTANNIRKKFLDYFAARGHRVVRSSSLVPADDPTLLFTNAGMNQFKDVFLGREKRDYARACSSQKCVRAGGKHNDLEQVGRTTRHHTFFEMLGNFSFGDYFKKEAIPWAWELVTREYAIPREKLYVTVFREDDDAEAIWAKDVGVRRERIFRRDEADNFWAMGETGPCGPCSEIQYDLGPAASELGHKDCKFPCPDDCGRYVEIWNLVFMQFNRDEQGKLAPLPRPSIDTGAGLERLTTVLQGKISNFDTDLFRPLIEEAASLANVEYGSNHETDVSLRIIADHARATTFLISDGVLPSNEGRGYVLRLILRRALYHGQTLGLNEPFMFKLSGEVVETMKDAYPELAETAQHVAKAIKIEEDRYAHTTRVGLERLEESPVVFVLDGQFYEVPFRQWKSWARSPHPVRQDEVRKVARESQQTDLRADVPASIPGDELFRLYDTFGLRPDFVEDIVKNYGVGIDLFNFVPTGDREGYNQRMEGQRERARASWKGTAKKAALPIYQELAEKAKTDYDPYGYARSDACQVTALVADGRGVDQVTPGLEPKSVEIVLGKTPFYAEAGGQVGDTGRLIDFGTQDEIASVTDTFSPVSGLVVHKAVVRRALRKGDFVTPIVNAERRDAIRRNHTGTHLLHAALRSILGTHVKQAGSLVAPDRLRFDFSHYAALDEQDLLDIEDLVNEHVLANEAVETAEMELDAALNSGAMALFGEKYGDKVRVVSITDFSKELCGGTHVRRTGDIGLFKIISETSVAAGTRRIEALTGQGVLDYLRRSTQTLSRLADALRAKPDELLETVEKLTESDKKLRKQLESQQLKRAGSQADKLAENIQIRVGSNLNHWQDGLIVKVVKDVPVASMRVEMDRGAMRQMVDGLRPKLGSGVIVLGSVSDGSPGQVALVAAVSKDLTNRLDAGKIVKEIATLVGGTGGGRKDLAEAGGKSPEKLDESLQTVPSIIEKML